MKGTFFKFTFLYTGTWSITTGIELYKKGSKDDIYPTLEFNKGYKLLTSFFSNIVFEKIRIKVRRKLIFLENEKNCLIHRISNSNNVLYVKCLSLLSVINYLLDFLYYFFNIHWNSKNSIWKITRKIITFYHQYFFDYFTLAKTPAT